MNVDHPFSVRLALIGDIPFLVETIIEAEKAGTETLPYSTVFGLPIHKVRECLEAALHEESDNCELSLSSYLVATVGNRPVAAVSAWIEGLDGMTSSALKGNILSIILPSDCVRRASSLNGLLSELYIEAIPGSIQIGVSYVAPDYRGHQLIGKLIESQIRRLASISGQTGDAFVQVFGVNKPAIRSYERIGFTSILKKEAANNEIISYLPDKVKILMRKGVKSTTLN